MKYFKKIGDNLFLKYYLILYYKFFNLVFLKFFCLIVLNEKIFINN